MTHQEWQKSSFSTNGVECVEVARTPEAVLIRESEAPGRVLTTTPARLRGLVTALKAESPATPSRV
ncbi:hypothetical protein GCM10027160_33310 [Streptomyces calidiresistens]|uniref:DUF397 domain-containing protein n=1 Tax=Streptomyces calidiresistens TaxID=1485586 RepID=A0A7W3T4L5_9ACTN|nr:DUF397 domain-containing protein [Streptomyces calidiresistens]MBB0230838.1 DUF397 domain-containing protein [Streptomyces calidiresistens]